ncbi:hypothetical protein ScPMuIL_003447 [Solemya velum]
MAMRFRAWRTDIPNLSAWTTIVFLFVLGFAIVQGNTTPHFTQFNFTIEPSDVVAVKGEPVLLNCSAYHGEITPSIQWLKNGEYLTLEENGRRQILENGSLYFTEVQHSKSHISDRGSYQCAATVDHLGTIVSRKAVVNIAHLSKTFEAEPQDLSIYLHDTAMFECRLPGVPSPNITWYKDEEQIATSTRIRTYTEGVLEIMTVQFSDFGSYKCIVENIERARTSRVATLQQNPNVDRVHQGIPPNFVITPRDTNAVVGGTAILFCAANGMDNSKKPTVTWLKGGVTIDLEETQGRVSVVESGHLQLLNVEEGDSGTYTCRAVNSQDSVDADASLTVMTPPTFGTKPRHQFEHVNKDVLFECNINGMPKPAISWMRNGDPIVTSDYFQIVDGRSLRILGLVKSDDGFYQCFGENELGSVQSSAQLVVLESDTPLPTTTPTHLNPLHHLGYVYGDTKNLPSKPKSLIAAITNTRFVTLSWGIPERTGPSEIIAYSIYWKEIGSVRERVMNTTRQEANIQHLKPDTDYEFRLFAYNRFGPSVSAATLTVHTDEEVDVPRPAVNVRATPLSPTSIRVEWDPPEQPRSKISQYMLNYYEVGANKERQVSVNTLSHTLQGLQKFREYSFRVVAYNDNGPGMSTEEFVAKTFSDMPTEPPQNFTLETASSTSIIVHWEPPPEDSQNGIITGYKIRYKKSRRGLGTGSRRGDTVTTDSNRRLYVLTSLRKDSEYQIRIAAQTVNGSGPSSPWKYTSTYLDDLDESIVPLPPGSLNVKPKSNSVMVTWAPPPAESKVLVRGYILGYGKGIADVYSKTLDADRLYYKIDNLQPASQYVITIKAFNNRGDGAPRYETVVTEEESTPEPTTPMMPPVGLKANVLSSQTILLTWTDTSLGRSQKINDNRYYTLRYSVHPNNNRRYRTINSTDLNAHISDLKPYTQYEFSVRVIKGRRQSTWSMSAYNTTQQAAPGTVPRDLTTVPVEGNPMKVTLNWQPPLRPNGQITGYLVFYTTDSSQDDRDWVVEGVLGDKLSTTIEQLTPDTTYYFKIQARNNKGYGPMSPFVTYKTFLDGKNPKDGKKTSTANSEGSNDEVLISRNVMIIIIACVAGGIFCIVVIVTVVLCRKRTNGDQSKRQPQMQKGSPSKGGKVIKLPAKDVKPPDLWIHHDHLELKNMEKPERSESQLSMNTMRRNSQDTKSIDDMLPDSSYHSGSEREERYAPPPAQPAQQTRNLIRPKPIMIPVDSQPLPSRDAIATVTAIPNGSLSMQGSDTPPGMIPMRPVYPRTQYNMPYSTPPRVNAGDLTHTSATLHGYPVEYSYKLAVLEEDDTIEEPYTGRVGYGYHMPDPPISQLQHASNASISCDLLAANCNPRCLSPDGSKSLPRGLHPLKSFSVPSPPQSATSTHPLTHIVKPQQSASPYKKPTPPVSSVPIKPRQPMKVISPKAPDVLKGQEEDIQKSLSTEELTAEMENLDVLMKDLNAITQQNFECC